MNPRQRLPVVRGSPHFRHPLAIGGTALIPIAVLFLLGGHFRHLAEILLWLTFILWLLVFVLFGRRRRERRAQVENEAKESSHGAAFRALLVQRQIESAQTKTSLWGPLKNPIFRSLWLASLVSGTAIAAQDTALRWIMNGLSTSSLLLSAISTLTFLAFCLLTFPAGMLADRIDRKRMLETINLCLAAASGLLIMFAVLQGLNPPIILGFTFILACGMATTAPAWTALMPEVVEEKYWPSVSALGGVQLNISGIVGPAIGGLLIPAFGTTIVFALAAAGFLVLAWSIRSSGSCGSRSFAEGQKTWSALIRELMDVLASQRSIQIVIVRSVLFSVFISVIPTLLPVVGLKVLRLDSTGLGLLFTSLGIGAVIGGFWIVPVTKARFTANGVTILASVMLGLAYFLMGCTRHQWLFMLVAAIGGMAWTLAAAELWAAGLHTATAGLRGRVNAILMVVSNAGLVAGGLLWGAMPDHYGIEPTLHAASIILLSSLPLLFCLSIDFQQDGLESRKAL
jgi:MFS family permease